MIVETVVSLLVVWLTWSVITTYMMRRKMPPGPFPFPLVGNFPHMLCDPADPISKLAEKYGDIYTLSFPTGNIVVLNTASLVREAKLKKKDDLAGRTPESMYPFNEMLADGLTTIDYSPKYVFQKKVFLSSLHDFESGMNFKSPGDQASYAVKIMLEEIESNDEKRFCPRKLIHASIVAQFWKMMTTNEVALDDSVVKSITEFGRLVGSTALKGTLYQIIPLASYLPSQFNRDIKRAIEIRDTTFSPQFRAHLQTYQPNVIRDLTDSFISAFRKETTKQDGKDVGSVEVVVPGLMIDVFAAGAETTSSSLGWFILFMVLHEDVQEEIHKEIDLIVGRDRYPDLEDAKNMSYLQASLCEVIRITSVIPFGGTNAIRDTAIAGYHIPKGTLVAMNLARVHHDEREWPEPDVFKPERFLDSEENFVGWTKLHGFMPFGLGRRECTGQWLARKMMLTLASNMLHCYEFVLPGGAEKPTTKISAPAMVLRPEDFDVLAKKRF